MTSSIPSVYVDLMGFANDLDLSGIEPESESLQQADTTSVVGVLPLVLATAPLFHFPSGPDDGVRQTRQTPV